MPDFSRCLTDFIQDYPVLSCLSEDLSDAFDVLLKTCVQGGTIFTCGNGGSAADAEHIVGELMKSFAFHRPIAQQDKNEMARVAGQQGQKLADNLEGAIRAIALTEGSAFSSAFANDVSFEYAFAQKLYGLCRRGDTLLAISTSGNSKNVLAAAQVAKSMGVITIALTGQSGGELNDWAEVCIKVPAQLTHKIQELHLPIYHFLCFALEQHIFGQNQFKTSNQSGCEIPKAPVERLKQVSHIIFDFDGVLTDNHVWVNQEGIESVRCNRGDGIGNQQLNNAGLKCMILSTEANPVVARRAEKLNLSCVNACGNKAKFVAEFLAIHSLNAENLMFVGNDINDLDAMFIAGVRVCPRDAHPKVLAISDYVLPLNGGEGVMRAVAQLLGID
ncbi:MAG: SIS domain-containing protein [Paraglaciecola sp.]|nr:SIS domain-containing protein [Paraglaciecola sp.]